MASKENMENSRLVYCAKKRCPWRGNAVSKVVCECLNPIYRMARCKSRLDQVRKKEER